MLIILFLIISIFIMITKKAIYREKTRVHPYKLRKNLSLLFQHTPNRLAAALTEKVLCLRIPLKKRHSFYYIADKKC